MPAILALALAALLGSAPSRAADGEEQVIYYIEPGGDLLYSAFLGLEDDMATWRAEREKIGTSWDFRQVFSGGDGVIFAIRASGELLYYKYLGLGDGSVSWKNAGLRIGTGWSFRQVFSAGNGVILAIRDDGAMLYYKYEGLEDGSPRWGKTAVPIGTGWSFRHVFSMGNGVILAIRDDGTMLYYKYEGLEDGSPRWGKTAVPIGTGWDFWQVFGGRDGAIFAIRGDEMLYYEYRGLEDGSATWGAQGVPISYGWEEGALLFAEAPVQGVNLRASSGVRDVSGRRLGSVAAAKPVPVKQATAVRIDQNNDGYRITFSTTVGALSSIQISRSKPTYVDGKLSFKGARSTVFRALNSAGGLKLSTRHQFEVPYSGLELKNRQHYVIDAEAKGLTPLQVTGTFYAAEPVLIDHGPKLVPSEE